MGAVVLIGSTKGGSGKSTITTNLSAHLAGEGHKVLIIDADKQGTSARWHERRENPEINPSPLPKVYCQQNNGNVYSAVSDAAKLYDIVLVDAGGNDSRELRTAMVAADVLYVPLQASQFDLETLETLNEMITGALDQNPTLQVFGLLSCAPSNPLNNEVNEAKELLAQFPLFGLADSVIYSRKAYRDVTPMGKGVVEYRNPQAKAEIQLLAQEIFG